MFYYINGELSHIENNLVVLDVCGVGYAIFTSASTISNLKIGQTYKLFTYLHVKEDIFDLFGFYTNREKSFFKKLISVSGVGPKAALSILSIAPIDTIALAIMSGDEKMLTKASGIGKKIALRIILELRDKVLKTDENIVNQNISPDYEDAFLALNILGYSNTDIMAVLGNIDIAEKSTDEMIKLFLKTLG